MSAGAWIFDDLTFDPQKAETLVRLLGAGMPGRGAPLNTAAWTSIELDWLRQHRAAGGSVAEAAHILGRLSGEIDQACWALLGRASTATAGARLKSDCAPAAGKSRLPGFLRRILGVAA